MGTTRFGYLEFPNADISMVRDAAFGASADGAGNLGSIAVSGTAANLGGASMGQTVAGVVYSLAGQGPGTINFGPASSTQLISGAKNLYISADHSIVLGGSSERVRPC